MHEYALAQNIVDTICDRVTRRLETVTEISVQVGRFSGVVVDSLSFGLQTILSEHKKTDTAIHITEIPSIAECRPGRLMVGCHLVPDWEHVEPVVLAVNELDLLNG